MPVRQPQFRHGPVVLQYLSPFWAVQQTSGLKQEVLPQQK